MDVGSRDHWVSGLPYSGMTMGMIKTRPHLPWDEWSGIVNIITMDRGRHSLLFFFPETEHGLVDSYRDALATYISP